jgi:SynChlorMet cassette protein ScmD
MAKIVLMKPADNPIANPVVILKEEFDRWAFLFNPETADAVVINPTGVAIWNTMDGKKSIKGIAEEIKRSFEEVPENCLDQVASFVNDLERLGFVGRELK